MVISGNYLYVIGVFSGTARFDNIDVQANGSDDIFLAKYTLQGSLVWVRSAGGTQQDFPNALAADEAGNVYLTGLVQGEGQFGGYVLMAEINLRIADDHTHNSSNHVAFYLNPIQSEIVVESADPFDVVQILDMSGKIILEKKSEHEYSARLGIKALPPGLYVVWTSSKEKIKSAEFSIQR